MIAVETQYLALLERLLEVPPSRPDRTKTGTRSLFGEKLIYPNGPDDPFPLLQSKRVHVRSIVEELAWMLLGRTDVQYLQERGVRIWNEWARPDGSLGPIYGRQWRNLDAGGVRVDQLATLVWNLVHDPWSRRHVVSAWNVLDLPFMALVPCHMMMQWYVSDTNAGRVLDVQVYQRSADVFLGLPFNLASYAFLHRLVADICGYTAGTIHYVLGDVHLYSNHEGQAKQQLSRAAQIADLEPAIMMMSDAARDEILTYREWLYASSQPFSSAAFDLAVVAWRDGVQVVRYNSLAAIKAPVAV